MSSLVLDGLALVAAILLAAIGGEAFLRGVLGFSAWLRLPKMLVATTLAAFATSSPELTVSSLAALAGKPEIGLGDALGSNVVNIALVLGIALMFGSLPARLEEIRRDMILALAVPPITFFLISDGVLSRADGAVLLCLFVFWLGMMVRQALHHRRRQAEEAPDAQGVKFWLISLYALLGLGSLLILAGARDDPAFALARPRRDWPWDGARQQPVQRARDRGPGGLHLSDSGALEQRISRSRGWRPEPSVDPASQGAHLAPAWSPVAGALCGVCGSLSRLSLEDFQTVSSLFNLGSRCCEKNSQHSAPNPRQGAETGLSRL